MSWWLSKSGEKLFTQVDERWPRRDTASDGSIGDESHQAAPSDHNPCWSCTGEHYGVVRAIDVDADLDRNDPKAMQRLAAQLIRCARDKQDNGRLSYVIFDGLIASGTYASAFWTWRPYSGSNTHEHHMHVSFTWRGDLRDGSFPLPIFTGPERNRLRKLIRSLTDRIESLRRARAKKSKKLAALRGI